MSTLAEMKSRIADELARADLTTQIAYAIGDAIKAYNNERFIWQETRNTTFSTVADQAFYDGTEISGFANIVAIDSLHLDINGWNHKLVPLRPQDMESASSSSASSGQPGWYCYFGQQIRLYPAPSGVWTGRITGPIKTAAPANDDETDNAWMVDAERLIRSRAKLELAMHVIYDDQMANTLSLAVKEAYDQLKEEATSILQTEPGEVKPWC